MINIRRIPLHDLHIVNKRIADLFSEFSLFFAPPEERHLYIPPARCCKAQEKWMNEASALVLRSSLKYLV